MVAMAVPVTIFSEHRSSPYHSDMTIFVQRVAELVSWKRI
jgi:hypothetical protein